MFILSQIHMPTHGIGCLPEFRLKFEWCSIYIIIVTYSHTPLFYVVCLIYLFIKQMSSITFEKHNIFLWYSTCLWNRGSLWREGLRRMWGYIYGFLILPNMGPNRFLKKTLSLRAYTWIGFYRIFPIWFKIAFLLIILNTLLLLKWQIFVLGIVMGIHF